MVYIPFFISHVPPAHSFFKKKSILKNLCRICGNLFFAAYKTEILEEHFGSAGTRSAVLGVVRALDVDGGGDRRVRRGERSRLAAGAGDTVALRLGSLDDQLDVGHIRRDAGQREGHRSAGERDGGVGLFIIQIALPRKFSFGDQEINVCLNTIDVVAFFVRADIKMPLSLFDISIHKSTHGL